MPKIKTHSGASKRFKMTKTGKIKRAHVGRRHILNKKSTKRLRHLRKEGFADSTNVAQVSACCRTSNLRIIKNNTYDLNLEAMFKYGKS